MPDELPDATGRSVEDAATPLAPDVILLPAFDDDDFAIADEDLAIADEDGPAVADDPGSCGTDDHDFASADDPGSASADEAASAAALPVELDRWLDAYDFERTIAVEGANAPVLATADGLAITATGMGKVATAATTTALCASPRLDLAETVFVSVGVAGAPPARATLGSVFVADAVVDWDVKHRWSESDAPTGERPIAPLRYRPHDYVHRLDDDRVARAATVARDVDLADDASFDAYRERFPESAATGSPGVGVGPTLTGDEFWVGETLAERADWLCETYDVAPYCTTQMEDYATATALERFGHLERYLSVRAVANFDRPVPGQSVRGAIADEGEGFALDLALENAFRVGRAVVADVRTTTD